MGDRRPRRGRGMSRRVAATGRGTSGRGASGPQQTTTAPDLQPQQQLLQEPLQPSPPPVPSLVQSPQEPSAPKVAIPRLRRQTESGPVATPSRAGDKPRVSHACEPCRQKKTKCTGERPVCKHCQDFKISCYYADGKRDKAKRELSALIQRVEKYEEVLRQISPQLDGDAQMAVQMALVRSPSPEDLSATGRSTDPGESEEGGESHVQADVGSVGSLDRVDEDVISAEGSRATGFLGKNSDVTWMQRVHSQLLETSSSTGARPTTEVAAQAERTPATHGLSEASGDLLLGISTYHLDDLNMSIIGDQIDPYALPLRATADALTNSYFATVHPSFPIVLKPLFRKQYDAFFKSFFPPDSSRRWLAMLNLIFAVGAIHAHMTKAEWQGDDRDHLQYFARARILALDGGAVFEMPDLQQVQVIGLSGYYLVASNQTNRAWNLTGLAIRYAQSLGLHLRNTTKSLTDGQKEMRVRIWYSIYSLEQLLCAMTGRPGNIKNRDCSVPLPSAIEDDNFQAEEGPIASDDTQARPSQSRASASIPSKRALQPSSQSETITSSLGPGPASRIPLGNAAYFVHYTKLNILTAEVLGKLYAAKTAKSMWSDVQTLISELDIKLSKWKSELPSSFDFGRKQRDQTFLRQRMCLGFLYNSTRAIINRPCLCRIERRIPNESGTSKEMCRFGAHACVDAARSSLNFIPDEPNTIGLCNISPWWCVLHYIVQAGAILVIELAFRAEHAPQEADGILKDAKKAVNWLHAMSAGSLAAHRSWTSLDRLLRLAAPRVGGNTADMPQDIPEAPDAKMTGVKPTGPEQATVDQLWESDIWNQDQFLLEQPRMVFGGVTQGSYPFGQFMPIHGHPVFTDGETSSMFPTSSQIENMTDPEEEWPQPHQAE